MMPPWWSGLAGASIIGAWAVVWSSFHLQFFHDLAGRVADFASQFDPMGGVNETVEDRIGVGRVVDDVMPAVHGELGCDDGRAMTLSALLLTA